MLSISNALLSSAMTTVVEFLPTWLDVPTLQVGSIFMVVVLVLVLIDVLFIPTAIISIVSTIAFFIYLTFVAFSKDQMPTALVLFASFFLLAALLGYVIITKELYRVISFDKKVPRENDNDLLKLQIGKQGVAVSDLRPSGKIKIENKVYDGLSKIKMISAGEAIEVVGVSSTQLLVRRSVVSSQNGSLKNGIG